MQVAQIVLFTRDVPRLQAFYGGILDMPVISAEQGWVRLDAGVVLALHAIPAHIPLEPDDRERSDVPVKICFYVDDVAEVRAKLLAANVAMRELRSYAGIDFCDGLDPDGNVFQITGR